MSNDKLKIEFLKPENCVFSFNSNGFLVMTLEGELKGRVKLIRTYPYSLTDEYICVHDLDDNEIGIIRDLKELDQNSKERKHTIYATQKIHQETTLRKTCWYFSLPGQNQANSANLPLRGQNRCPPLQNDQRLTGQASSGTK